MEQPSSLAIAASILSAPAWVRVGITVRDERMRERAARELGRIIADEPEADPRQLALPIGG